MLRKICIVIALFSAFTLAIVEKDGGTPIQPPPSSSTEPPTPGPKTTTTTTTTTPPPKTTTDKANTTTAGPTSPPTTSHSTVPTTAVPTTPLPPPAKSHYTIEDGNTTCIIADLAVQIVLKHDNETWKFDVPANLSTNGSRCNNETQDLVLSWKDGQSPYVLTFQFSKNETSKKFVSQITLSVETEQNSTTLLTEEDPLFSTSLSKSYRCEKEQEIELTEGTNKTRAFVKISQLQLEAFHTSEDNKFSAAEDCAGSSSPDVVPIAVGCALVGLIAIVLIAYLVGRRRSQARGYLSM